MRQYPLQDEFYEVQKRLTREGNIIISVGLFGHSGDEEVWENMDEGTLAKTKEMLDDSTRSEIEYAAMHGKKVRYLEDNENGKKH